MPTKHPAVKRSNPQETGAGFQSSSTDSDSSESVAILSDPSSSFPLHGERPKYSPNGSQKGAPPLRAGTGQSGSDHTPASQDEYRTRWKDKSQTQSESGTEADDESYGLIKALPPPPVKPRKGLRGFTSVGSDGGSTPLLSPSIIDEDAKKEGKEYFQATPGNVGRRSSTDNERRTGMEKLKRRRRAELKRRALETILFGAIGFSVLRGPRVWELAWTCDRVELLSFVFVFAILVVSYPSRLLFYLSRLAPTGGHQPRPHIRVPSAFDPATLLYPTCLPVLVALSLLPTTPKYLLPNITLGLAALPPRLIPKIGQGHGYNAHHWIITLIPTIASETIAPHFELSVPRNYMPKARTDVRLSPEDLFYLYPLQQALLGPLEYLTTTSLLRTELQLLSVSLTNILLFSTSPQATILLSLLLVGGLALFILCSRVVRWGVTLARIPKLKFNQAGQSVRRKKPLIERVKSALWRGIGGRSSFGGRQELIQSDADDTDESEETSINVLTHKVQPKLGTSSLPTPQPFVLASREVQSAVDDTRQSAFGRANRHNGDVKCPRVPPRSATMPSMNGSASRPSLASNRSHKRASFSSVQSYLQLTPTQASIRKWLYAIYLYVVILVIIFTAVRGVVGRYALNGKEPVGWALGYLLGNIRPFRHLVCYLGLEKSWIPLPIEYVINDSSTPNGLAERLRQDIIGEANTRLLLCAYYITITAMGLLAVLRFPITEVDTRRKVFHGMMVVMFLPTIFVDPAFVALALSLVLAIFLLLELIRASQLPPLSRPLAHFLQPYVDGRDLRGPVIASHIFLLIGCAIPLWLSLAGIERTGDPPWEGWDVETRDVSMVAGVICVGMGDAAASLVGRRYGRRRWPWAGGKSLEGSLAFVIAVTVGLTAAKVWLTLGGWEQPGSTRHGNSSGVTMGKIVLAASGASVMEAVLTGANDNVLVPVILWLLVRGLGI